MYQSRTQQKKTFGRAILIAAVLFTLSAWSIISSVPIGGNAPGRFLPPGISTAHATGAGQETSEARILLRLNTELQLQQELRQFGEALLLESGFAEPEGFLKQPFPGKITLLYLPNRAPAAMLALLLVYNPDFSLEPASAPGQRGAYELAFTAEGRKKRIELLRKQTLAVIQERLALAGIEAAVKADAQPERILIAASGPHAPEAVLHILGNTAPLEFRLTRDDLSPELDELPPGLEALPVSNFSGLTSYTERFMVVEKRVAMSGRHVSHAHVARSPDGGVFFVSLLFDDKGREEFAALTAASIGRGLAIIMDGQIVSAPRIMESITGGEASISGNFTVAEAQDLALALRAGALPAPMEVVDIQVTDAYGQ